MAEYEIDYTARVTYKVEAATAKEAVEIAESRLLDGAQSDTISISNNPVNIEVFVKDKGWVKCDLPDWNDETEGVKLMAEYTSKFAKATAKAKVVSIAIEGE